jgi:prolyl oligopeptidase
VTEILHGVEVRDPYRWLEDESAAEVRAWTAAQGTFARSVLDALPGREAIAARLAEALDCGMLGGTAPRGRRRFFARRTAGMDQAALYVADGDGMERTLVDPGPLSPDGTTALDWWAPSEDGELLCFGLSEAGSEDSTLRLLDVATGEWLEDAIPHCRLAAVAFEPGNAAPRARSTITATSGAT